MYIISNTRINLLSVNTCWANRWMRPGWNDLGFIWKCSMVFPQFCNFLFCVHRNALSELCKIKHCNQCYIAKKEGWFYSKGHKIFFNLSRSTWHEVIAKVSTTYHCAYFNIVTLNFDPWPWTTWNQHLLAESYSAFKKWAWAWWFRENIMVYLT